MPVYTFAQLGQKVKEKYPEYADVEDEKLGRATADKYPEYNAMIAPELNSRAAVPAQMKMDMAITDAQSQPAYQPKPTPLQERINARFPEVDSSQGVTRVGNHVVRGLTSAVTSLPDRIRNTRAYDLSSPTIESPIPGYVDTARREGAGAAIEDALGDAAIAEIMGRAASAAPEVVATGLNVTGRGVRRAGSLASRMGIGKLEGPHGIEGDVGAGISRNRVVGLTNRSINRKLTDRLGPATQVRDAILANSTAAPTDVSPLVDDAFTRVTSPKINPKTGAAQPGQIRRAVTSRRAIQEVADPHTGQPSGIAKDPNLTPLEMSQLQRNVYDMTDYDTPEAGVSNEALKSTGAKLKEAINKSAPEASTMTEHIHNTLEARDATKGGPEGELHGVGQLGIRAAKAIRTGVGTAVGAGMDVAGSAAQSLAGRIRSAGQSPVAPTPPRPQGQLTGATVQPPGPIPQPAPAPTPQIPAQAGPGQSPVAPTPTGIPHPGSPNAGTARTRIAPTGATPRAQQVITDAPGYTPPAGGRRIISTPEGLRPEAYPLGPGPQRPALDTSAGNRRSLLQRVRDEAKAEGLRHDAEIEASKAKLASTPEATVPPPTPSVGKAPVAGGKPKRAMTKPKPRPKLTERMATSSTHAPAPKPGGLPSPGDIDAWEELVDQGKARYNTHTHQYDYTAPGGRR